jgi:hypothetical protein
MNQYFPVEVIQSIDQSEPRKCSQIFGLDSTPTRRALATLLSEF